MPSGQIRMECPFRDNHPDGSGKESFFVTPEINAYHCFSCREHGNLIKLLVNSFDIGYFSAVELVRLSDYTPEERSFELDISWELKPPEAFLKRGFAEETLRHFKFGVDKKGWTVIPFYTPKGELVGYQRRTEKPERIVINSKDFNKAEYLYNYDDSFAYVVAVEGYSDVMRLFQHGYNATSALGADISVWQAMMLGNFERVYLAFDNDLAGRRATEICYHQIKNLTNVLLVPYTTKDPGECLSKKEWQRAFENSTDYMEYSTQMSMNWDGYLEMKEKVLRELAERSKR